jgi:hypothetical protein
LFFKFAQNRISIVCIIQSGSALNPQHWSYLLSTVHTTTHCIQLHTTTHCCTTTHNNTLLYNYTQQHTAVQLHTTTHCCTTTHNNTLQYNYTQQHTAVQLHTTTHCCTTTHNNTLCRFYREQHWTPHLLRPARILYQVIYFACEQ